MVGQVPGDADGCRGHRLHRRLSGRTWGTWGGEGRERCVSKKQKSQPAFNDKMLTIHKKFP